MPHGDAALTEIAMPAPVENADDAPLYVHHTLEERLADVTNERPAHEQEALAGSARRRRSLEEAYERIKKDEQV